MLLHIVTEADWDRASMSGEPYFAEGQDVVGFMHLSRPEQVLIPANLFYKGREGLVLVVIDEDVLGPELKWEQGVPPSGGMLFPHLYGPLDPAAAIGVVPFPCDGDGSFTLPDLTHLQPDLSDRTDPSDHSEPAARSEPRRPEHDPGLEHG